MTDNKGRVCLGTVKLGVPDYGFNSNSTAIKDPESFLNRVVEECGITHFDTSPRYGDSEIILGNFFKNHAEPMTVDTKVDELNIGDSDIEKTISGKVLHSLERLHQSINTLYLHQNEMEIISNPKVLDALQKQKNEERVKSIGASVYSLEELEYVLSEPTYDVVQVPINVFSLDHYHCLLKRNTKKKIMARSLLLQGLLTQRKGIPERIPSFHQNILGYLSKLDQLSQKANMSTLELALAFIGQLPCIDHFIIGTTDITNLKKSQASLQKSLKPSIADKLIALASTSKAWSNPRNWT